MYIAVALNGSGGTPKEAWFTTSNSLLDILSTEGGRVRKVGSVKAGRLAEGAVFSPEGEYLYVGNFLDGDLQIYKIEAGNVRDTGKTLKLPGHPASMRGSSP